MFQIIQDSTRWWSLELVSAANKFDECFYQNKSCTNVTRLFMKLWNIFFILLKKPVSLGALGASTTSPSSESAGCTSSLSTVGTDGCSCTWGWGTSKEKEAASITAAGANDCDGILRKAKNLCLSCMVEAVRSRKKTIDIDNVNRVLIQPHWRIDKDPEHLF